LARGLQTTPQTLLSQHLPGQKLAWLTLWMGFLTADV